MKTIGTDVSEEKSFKVVDGWTDEWTTDGRQVTTAHPELVLVSHLGVHCLPNHFFLLCAVERLTKSVI